MRFDITSIVGIFGGIAFGIWEILTLFAPGGTDIRSHHGAGASPAIVRTTQDNHETELASLPSKTGNSEQDNTSSDIRSRLEKKIELLKQGRAFIDSKRDYTAILDKREVVHGELLDEQSMLLKCRQKPFSVYLRWMAGDVGRECIYIDGKNRGKMIAHDGGWKARIPAFYLEPDCKFVMRDSRYPVTCAGLRFVIETMLEIHEHDLKTSNLESCQITDRPFDGRDCVAVTTKYKSREVSKIYRKATTLFDRETSVLLSTEHFEWPRHSMTSDEKGLDDATLIEKYSFRNLRFDQHLSDTDFDRDNKEYDFR